MSHHSDQPFDDGPHSKRLADMMRQLKDTASFRGEIGAYPEGKLTKQDEGAIQFGVSAKDGKVVLDFGKPVAWIGMNPQQAADLAADLFKWARLAGMQKGEVVSLDLGR